MPANGPNFGRGMIFPSSYGRDQFSAEQEREMEAGQAAEEARAEAHAEARVTGAIALWKHAKREWGWGGAEWEGCEDAAYVAIDAYLEALNAH